MEAAPGISLDRCIGGVEVGEPQLSPDGSALVYSKSAGGTPALMVSMLDGSPPRQLTSSPAPRVGRGFGGGCFAWLPDSTAVVYAAVDGCLWLQPLEGPVRALTTLVPAGAAQAPAVSPDGTRVAYVVDRSEVWIASVAATDDAVRVDAGDADFCIDPAFLGHDVAWTAWDVPDMPWDRARLERLDLRTGARLRIEGTGSTQQARSGPRGSTLAIRDDGGWNNLWLDDRPLVAEPFEHAGPAWGLGQRSFALSPDGRSVAFTRNERGFGRLCTVDIATGLVTERARGVHGQLSWSGSKLAALRSGARTPPQIVVHDTDDWSRTVVDVGGLAGWPDAALVEPELIETSAHDGATIHARLYPASGTAQGLICWVHGGPTDQWQVTFMPRVAYWRGRGFHVLVPDHRGSTGHGRAYQQAMNGRWGELDVSDVVDAVRDAQRKGLASPERTVLCGGSAGGFTVLGVLAAAPDVAACAVVSYPVSDLYDIAVRGDRFERHSTHHLVGALPPSPPSDGAYADRSPVRFASRIATPLLVFHGDADPVVPIEQSRALVAAMRAAGADAELVELAGEGHGFRAPANQVAEYTRTGEFIARHLGPARQ